MAYPEGSMMANAGTFGVGRIMSTIKDANSCGLQKEGGIQINP
jgi:hypothetical protein